MVGGIDDRYSSSFRSASKQQKNEEWLVGHE